MLARERELWATGLAHVAGVDEVGVGPLAGPVVAAAVVLPRDVKLVGVRDSKTLTAAQRAPLDERIRATAVAIAVGVVEVEEIDRLNIYWASIRAMALAVAGLAVTPEHLLIDGRARRIPECAVDQTAIVDGDRLVYSIAAASIVAKEHRDRLMRELDGKYPGYGFARHVGYATAAHMRALKALGPCAIHRRSFAPVRELLGL
jgi:ribonuclease HII